MNKIIKSIAVVGMLCMSLLRVQANNNRPVIARDTLDPFLELMNARLYYTTPTIPGPRGTPYYYVMKQYSGGTVVDSFATFMSARVNGEKSFALLLNNKMEYVQDEMYNATVMLEDSVIYVNNPQSVVPALFQIDIFNPEICKQIDSISMVDSPYAGIPARAIKIKFKPESSYIDYYTRIVYADSTNYTIFSIHYRLKGEIVPAGQPITSYTQVNIDLTSYGWTPITDDTFFTKRFFKRENGVFVPVAPYTNFQIIDATKQ